MFRASGLCLKLGWWCLAAGWLGYGLCAPACAYPPSFFPLPPSYPRPLHLPLPACSRPKTGLRSFYSRRHTGTYSSWPLSSRERVGPGEAPPGTKGFCPKLSQTKLLIWGQSGTEGRVFVWLKSALGLSTKRCRDKRYTKAMMVHQYGEDNIMGAMTNTQ